MDQNSHGPHGEERAPYPQRQGRQQSPLCSPAGYKPKSDKAKTARYDEQHRENRKRARLPYLMHVVLGGVPPGNQVQKPEEKQSEHCADEGTHPPRDRLLSSASFLQQTLGIKAHAL